MQIKKFEAVNMEEALSMVKAELGSDAVILSTKKVKKNTGAFGLFSRPLIEITAANDYQTALQYKETADFIDESDPVEEVIAKSFSSITETATATAPAPAAAAVSAKEAGRPLDDVWGFIRHGITEIKTEMSSFKQLYEKKQQDELSHVNNRLNELKTIITNMTAFQNTERKAELPVQLATLKNRLVDNGLNEFISNRLITFMQQKVDQKYFDNTEYLESYLASLIQKHIKTAGSLPDKNSKTRAVMFVGTTGVGKTTTIAKLAAEYSLNRSKKVALVTLDTYRIAALEQLKIYANILKIPVYVASNGIELANILKKTEVFDLTLIDTAGRSYNSEDHIDELKDFLNNNNKISVQLVLSANCKDKDLTGMADTFKKLPVDSILFTKLDETTTYGSIFNLMIHTDKPLSYFTTGQRVPEDIELANASRIANLVMGKK